MGSKRHHARADSDDTLPDSDTQASLAVETARPSVEPHKAPKPYQGWYELKTTLGSEWFLRHPNQPGQGPPLTVPDGPRSIYDDSTTAPPLHVPLSQGPGRLISETSYLLPGLSPPSKVPAVIPHQSEWHMPKTNVTPTTATSGASRPMEAAFREDDSTTSPSRPRPVARRRSFRSYQPTPTMQSATMMHNIALLFEQVASLSAKVSDLEATREEMMRRDTQSRQKLAELEKRVERYEDFIKTFMGSDFGAWQANGQQVPFQMQYNGVPLQFAALDGSLAGGKAGSGSHQTQQAPRKT